MFFAIVSYNEYRANYYISSIMHSFSQEKKCPISVPKRVS
jgi:hypothetical protein